MEFIGAQLRVMTAEPIIAPAWGQRPDDPVAHFWSPYDPDWRSACGVIVPADLTFGDIPYLFVSPSAKRCTDCADRRPG